MPNAIDIDKLASAMREAAEAEILPRFGQLADEDIRQKKDATDLVTEGDEAAEKFLQREIARLLPDALFVGEESAVANPALLAGLSDAELAVVVDPIDGTANFVAGMPLFGVMLGVLRRGETVAGIIYDPIGKSWFMTEKGSGAFRTTPEGDRTKLKVAAPVPLKQMVGHASTDFLPAGIKPGILANLAKPRLFAHYRCAAHMYRTFASGHIHFNMLDNLTPWDHLAGALIATEAGGHVACFDGSPYNITKRDGCILAATDPDSWHTLMHEVFAS